MKSIEKFKKENGIKDNSLEELFQLTLTSYDFKEEIQIHYDWYYYLLNEAILIFCLRYIS